MQNKLNIVLVEPEIPQNTGNIARTCAATGAALHLIEPLGFELSDRTLKRAGLDYWDKLAVTRYPSLSDFYEKNDGFFVYFSTKSKKRHTDISYEGNVYLFFGKETKGLPEKLLFDNYESCVRIPMLPDIRSLNLSNSAAIAVYEVLRQWNYTGFLLQGELTQNFEM